MAEAPVVAEARPLYRIEPLGKQHDRAAFTCGAEPLDRYFQTQVTQDVRRRLAKCQVAVDVASGSVVGFYTLGAISLALGELPEGLTKGLPRYPVIPAVLMGRLAVATSAQGQNLGAALVAHAVESVANSTIGAFAMVVDAKDEAAQRFYEHHGFSGIIGHPLRLVLPLATAMQALKLSDKGKPP
jgi:ribosomal protein S18 acetylase RimI-like enzyme